MKNSWLIIGVAVSVIVFVLAIAVLPGSKNQNLNQTQQTGEISPHYVYYSETALAKAVENNGKAVIFFHANWCPTCQAAEADFRANPDKIPSNVTILKTDYDTSFDLKRKYGAVFQDTFVQVDKDGDALSKWGSGGLGIQALVANLR